MTNNLREFNLEEARNGSVFICINESIATEAAIDEYHFFEKTGYVYCKLCIVVVGRPIWVNSDGTTDAGYKLYMKPRIIERWQNVYINSHIGSLLENKEWAEKAIIKRMPRTHYLKTYWSEEGVMLDDPKPELIKIENQ